MNSRRLIALLLAAAALAAALITGCGDDDDGGGEDVDVGPAAAAPENAPIYFEATVRPEGAAKTGAEGALRRILDTNDPGTELISLLDREGQQQPPNERFTYQADIEPWLGERIGLFVTSFEREANPTLVFETTNPGTALDFARRAESGARESQHGGTTYFLNPTDGDAFAAVGDFLVAGDEAGVQATIDAQSGDSLGDSGDFTDAIADLPEERLGSFYSVPRNILDAIPTDDLGPGIRDVVDRVGGENLDAPVSGSLTASEDSIDFEFVSEAEGAETPESSLVGEVPADAWLSLGIGDLGATLEQVLDQLRESDLEGFEQGLSQVETTSGATIDELTGALGDAALYVTGVTEPTVRGALVVQANDPELTERLLTQLRGLLTLGGASGVKPLNLAGGGTGIQFSIPQAAPQPIELAQQDDKLVIAYGAGSAQEAVQPAEPLSESPLFGAAEGEISDLGTDLFLSFPPIFQLAEASGAKRDPGYREAKRYIDALDYLISGSGAEGGGTEVQAVLGLK